MPHEYDLHWDCHECRNPIGTNEEFVIVEGVYVYHSAHRPPESTGMEKIHVLAPKPKEKN
jgi:hypothetical protein